MKKVTADDLRTMNKVSTKSEILAAIKSNLAASLKFGDFHAEHGSTSEIAPSSGAPSPRSLVDEFSDNLRAVGGKALHVRNGEDVGRALKSVLDELDSRQIAVSDSQRVQSVLGAITPKATVLACASAAELFECDVGVTEAQWAIAETGTLVLESDREASRLTSLVPATHICIVSAANIRATMSEILQLLETRLSPTVTFITGPSRTSDIELTLAIGVHGPANLYVIVVEDRSDSSVGAECL